MTRHTTWVENLEVYVVGQGQIQYNEKESGYFGEAIVRLAMYENFHEDLLREQEVLLKKLEGLRAEGKTRTVTFKQLVAAKLTNSHVLLLLAQHGLRE